MGMEGKERVLFSLFFFLSTRWQYYWMTGWERSFHKRPWSLRGFFHPFFSQQEQYSTTGKWEKGKTIWP